MVNLVLQATPCAGVLTELGKYAVISP
jgi:hypothetical protein